MEIIICSMNYILEAFIGRHRAPNLLQKGIFSYLKTGKGPFCALVELQGMFASNFAFHPISIVNNYTLYNCPIIL